MSDNKLSKTEVEFLIGEVELRIQDWTEMEIFGGVDTEIPTLNKLKTLLLEL